jgi:hypothetical protein
VSASWTIRISGIPRGGPNEAAHCTMTHPQL